MISHMSDSHLLDKIVALCKRRGFVYQGSEIYGGLANTYDFGPAGVEFLKNLKSLWWKKFVQERPDMIGISSGILMNPKVWEASGHLQSFTDPLVECKTCHRRFRTDKKEELQSHEHRDFTKPRDFNLMFKTFIGAVEDQSAAAYLRPETAQGMFINFRQILDSSRVRVPFGIAQIGKSFRNEITAGNFIFRTLEFEIAELEYFVKPGEDEEAFEKWLKFMQDFLVEELGLQKKNLKIHEHPSATLAHYSKRTIDIQYRFPWGWDELWGIANRTDFDLKSHEKLSGKSMVYRDPESGAEFVPYVIEPTGGIERTALAVLLDAYEEGADRVVLKFKPKLAPYKVAVFPLLANKPQLVAKARTVYEALNKEYSAVWDERGNIGKRYYAQDEVGTPYCVTVDFQTLEDDTVTVRDRDSKKQPRVKIEELTKYFAKLIG